MLDAGRIIFEKNKKEGRRIYMWLFFRKEDYNDF